MKREVLGVAIANAAGVGALVYVSGARPELAVLGVGAASIGGALGLLVGDWLERNGYTMEADR